MLNSALTEKYQRLSYAGKREITFFTVREQTDVLGVIEVKHWHYSSIKSNAIILIFCPKDFYIFDIFGKRKLLLRHLHVVGVLK